MAERNKITEAIVLTIRDQAENNRLVRFLSPDYGLFYAVLYGGAKSKMRSLVQQFNVGTLYFYDDTRHNSRKISDFDVTLCPETFYQNLYKVWAANMVIELLCKTQCAGDDKTSFTLLKAFIAGLNATEQQEAKRGTLRFLWRYLALLGVQPDVTECTACGTPFEQKNEHATYLPFISGFVCQDCMQDISSAHLSDAFVLHKDGLSYLNAINTLPPKDVRARSLPETTLWQLKNLLFYLTEQAAGAPLQTLKNGAGIL